MTAAPVFTLAPEEAPGPCKGAFARYRETAYRLTAARGVRHSWELYELRRRSCPGCPQCDSIWDILDEFPEEIELDPALQNGDVVALSVVVDSTDWETGHADDWHVLASRMAP